MSHPITEYSTSFAEFELKVEGGKIESWRICLLNVQATFKLQFLLGNQVKFAMGDKGIDPDLMWGLAQKLLKYSTVNGIEVTEAHFEEHFARRVEILDRVVVEALKQNLPGFTKQLTALLVQWTTKLSQSAIKTSDSMTSKSATGEKDSPSSQ